MGLSNLMSPADFWSIARHVFPTKAALEWFLRRNRRRLILAGALVTINRRLFLDMPVFEAEAIEICRARVTEVE